MATMVITRTQTQTQTMPPTEQHPEEPSRHATPQTTDQQNGDEHANTNRFLDRVPRLDRLRWGASRKLREIIRAYITTKSRGGGSTTTPVHSSLDHPTNILVMELGNTMTRRPLLSVNELRKYLRENRHPLRRVYLVSEDSLMEDVVGILGSKLNLDSDFFALHITRQDPPLGLNLPSSIAARQSLRFEYRRNVQGLPKERISFCVSQNQGQTWTGDIRFPSPVQKAY
jgi:hypothetical protein